MTPFAHDYTLSRQQWPLACALMTSLYFPGSCFICADHDSALLANYARSLGLVPAVLSGGPEALKRHLLGAWESSVVFQAMLRYDQAAACLVFLDAMARCGHQAFLARLHAMPSVYMRLIELDYTEASKPGLMRRMQKAPMDAAAVREEADGGVRFRHAGGWAWVLPSDDRPLCRIICEGNSAELADELSVSYADWVKAVEKA